MRVVVHMSDLHFGRIDPRLLEPLRSQVVALEPHVVVVSGDLTQRAKPDEFRAARAFLDTLPRPQVVVPGNHDVPLYNVFQRFFQPLDKFHRYISPDSEPSFVDAELAIVGINTARSLTFKGGRINQAQVAKVRELLCPLPGDVTKILVTHHPFDVPHHEDHHIVGRAGMAMRSLAECGADVLLAGHLHTSETGQTSDRYRIEGFNALVVQAGTATSTRGRGESNSFNVLRVDPRRIAIDEFAWDDATGRFGFTGTQRFRHTPGGWVPAFS